MYAEATLPDSLAIESTLDQLCTRRALVAWGKFASLCPLLRLAFEQK